MLLFNHALSEEGGKEKIFLFLSTITLISALRGWKLVPPSSPSGKESMAQIHKVVDFDFRCLALFSPCLLLPNTIGKFF